VRMIIKNATFFYLVRFGKYSFSWYSNWTIISYNIFYYSAIYPFKVSHILGIICYWFVYPTGGPCTITSIEDHLLDNQIYIYGPRSLFRPTSTGHRGSYDIMVYRLCMFRRSSWDTFGLTKVVPKCQQIESETEGYCPFQNCSGRIR